jgi:hypothetical protein
MRPYDRDMNEHATPAASDEPFGGLSHELPAQPEHISERVEGARSVQNEAIFDDAEPREFAASRWIPAAACLGLASVLPFLEATKTANWAGPTALLGAILLASFAKAQARKHQLFFAFGALACAMALAAIGWHAIQTWILFSTETQALLYGELERRAFWTSAAALPLPFAARAPRYLSLFLYASSAGAAAAMLFGVDFPWNISLPY